MTSIKPSVGATYLTLFQCLDVHVLASILFSPLQLIANFS